jgi:hypothetical protein
MHFWRLRLSRVRALCLFHRFLSIGAGYLIDESKKRNRVEGFKGTIREAERF